MTDDDLIKQLRAYARELERCGCVDSYLADDYETLMAAADRLEALLRGSDCGTRIAAPDLACVKPASFSDPRFPGRHAGSL